MNTAEKVLENRIRKTLARRGFRLEKSRQRDRQARQYGKYWVWDLQNNIISVPDRTFLASATGPETASGLLRRLGLGPEEGTLTLQQLADWIGEAK